MAHLIMIEYIEVAEEEASFFRSNLNLFMGCFEVEGSADEGSMAIMGLSCKPKVGGHWQSHPFWYVASRVDAADRTVQH